MPTYEYECKSCGHCFDVFQAMSDPPLKDCPKCSREVRRLIFGGSGVIFKGSGFYVTDKNKSDKKEKPASSKKPEGADTSAKSDAVDTAASSASSAGGGKPESSTGSSAASSGAKSESPAKSESKSA
jgi:putative FmdB family regulatory protein